MDQASMHGNVEQEIGEELRKQAATLDEVCSSNQDALMGLQTERALLEKHHAELTRRNDALVSHYHRSTEKAKAKAAELRRLADEIEKRRHDNA